MKKKPKAIPSPERADKSTPHTLPPDLNVDDWRNWNFDGLPEPELAACCHWEYARESATLRELRERCVEAWRDDPTGNWIYDYSDGSLGNIVRGTIRHRDNSVELFLREIVLQCPRDIWQSAYPLKPRYVPPDFPPAELPGSGFPDSWYSLAADERERRVRPGWVSVSKWQSLSADERAALVKEQCKMKPAIPFQRGRLRDAMAVVRTVTEHRKFALWGGSDELSVRKREMEREQLRSWLRKRGMKATDYEVEQRLMLQFSSIALNRPLNAPLDVTDRNDRLPGGFFYPDGMEVSVVEIDWAHFTDEEIAEAVAKNRPAQFRKRAGRPVGAFDAFAALDGLAIMRLLRHYKPSDAAKQAPKLWQRHKGKQLFRAREAAAKIFKVVCPFLPKAERPLSWRTKAGRSR